MHLYDAPKVKTPLFQRFQRQKQAFSRAHSVKIRKSGASKARASVVAYSTTSLPNISRTAIVDVHSTAIDVVCGAGAAAVARAARGDGDRHTRPSCHITKGAAV